MNGAELAGYQYVALRCVPRVDREEFINVGAVVYCQSRDFLKAGSRIDPVRLQAFSPDLDFDALAEALATIAAVCAGDGTAGSVSSAALGTRFGFLAAPRSTVIQPGPTHGGLTHDPERELDILLTRLVGPSS